MRRVELGQAIEGRHEARLPGGALVPQALCVTFVQPLNAIDGDGKKPADCTEGDVPGNPQAQT